MISFLLLYHHFPPCCVVRISYRMTHLQTKLLKKVSNIVASRVPTMKILFSINKQWALILNLLSHFEGLEHLFGKLMFEEF